jgi:hypothetical protein
VGRCEGEAYEIGERRDINAKGNCPGSPFDDRSIASEN